MKSLLLLLMMLSVTFSHSKDRIETIMVSGQKRSYIIYTPDNYRSTKNFPLVMAFHGGGGKSSQMMKLTEFNKLAEKEGFMVVYPQGINKHWNDGRNAPSIKSSNNDVKFISILIDKLITEYSINKDRIFATGISNGGIFALYLAYKLKNKIKAFAPVCAAYPDNLCGEFELSSDHSIIVINGTNDPLVPYNGGFVASDNSGRGSIVNSENMIKEFVKKLDCNSRPIVQKYTDNDPEDKCTAQKIIYKCTDHKNKIILVKVENGGHAWPGGKQYLPKKLIGNVCNDFDATKEIWSFFKSL